MATFLTVTREILIIRKVKKHKGLSVFSVNSFLPGVMDRYNKIIHTFNIFGIQLTFSIKGNPPGKKMCML